MKLISILVILVASLLSCISKSSKPVQAIAVQSVMNVSPQKEANIRKDIIDSNGSTVQTRVHPPKGYKRVPQPNKSYATYLRNLPLKPHGSKVRMYDGETKDPGYVYIAVIDLPIGKKDLHQCADAIMRLRAEYLWSQKRYDEIHFDLTNGFRVDYSQWMQGKRVAVKGNKTYWVDKGKTGNSYQDFWSYMEFIFTYAGTLSLSKELKAVSIENMEIGDVFIWGGSPGHAVLVIDMVENELGKKQFLLAQSYMPAQETQILLNPNNYNDNPWYELSEIIDELHTPEWRFESGDLKRFE